MATVEELKRIASQVRRDIIRMVTKAKSGHPGGSLSSTDILTALYFHEMKQDPATWSRDGKGQDMFILSAGHMSPVLYSVLARAGYFPVSELATFRQFGSRLQGHPSIAKGLPGVFQASGSLGQGLSAACGLAMGKKLDGDPNFVYCLCGDGESEEGQIWEAAQFAPHHSLGNLIAMTDWNGQQIDGTVSDVAGQGNLDAKWKAFGWNVIEADGHDMEAVVKAFDAAKANRETGKPTMILFHTEMGHGVDFMAGTCAWHGKAPSEEQCEAAMKQLDETLGDF
jgi:transketolase